MYAAGQNRARGMIDVRLITYLCANTLRSGNGMLLINISESPQFLRACALVIAAALYVIAPAAGRRRSSIITSICTARKRERDQRRAKGALRLAI